MLNGTRIAADAKEVRPVLPLGLTLINQSEKSFMDQRCHRDRAVRASDYKCLGLYTSASRAHQRIYKTVLVQVWILTPKALANSSPAVRAQREPWDSDKQSLETLKGFANR